MKLKEVKKLLALSKMKSDAEKARYGAINAAQAAMLAKAGEHAANAARPYEVDTDDLTGGDLSFYGSYLRGQEHAENRCRLAADNLEVEKQTRRSALSRSLGEEAVWSKIRDGAENVRRKKVNDAEETGRSDVITSAASAARRTSRRS